MTICRDVIFKGKSLANPSYVIIVEKKNRRFIGGDCKDCFIYKAKVR